MRHQARAPPFGLQCPSSCLSAALSTRCALWASGLCADVFAKFAASAWGQKLAKRAAKAGQTDFDRYKAMVQKVKRSSQVRARHGAAGAASGGFGRACGQAVGARTGRRAGWCKRGS